MLEVGKLYNTYGQNTKVKATGHSLGAALANLTAMNLAVVGYDVSLYNFGQPRVGNKEYADFCNKMIPDLFRHVHYRDIVPHVPIEKVMSFKHSSTEIF